MTDENSTYQKTDKGQPLALEKRDLSEDGRRFSPSIGRNKQVVLEAYMALMPKQGRILEIASGTGEHGANMTDALPDLHWTYSDIDAASQVSQNAWRNHAQHDRLHGSIYLDTTATEWAEAESSAPWDGLFCANMIHIAPFEAALGLIDGAGRLLRPEGRLMLYGPFARKGDIAPSNERFSADLQRRDARWGVRDLDTQIVPQAAQVGLALSQVIEMPANNLSVVFEKS